MSTLTWSELASDWRRFPTCEADSSGLWMQWKRSQNRLDNDPLALLHLQQNSICSTFRDISNSPSAVFLGRTAFIEI
jgi:hypothetical protein